MLLLVLNRLDQKSAQPLPISKNSPLPSSNIYFQNKSDEAAPKMSTAILFHASFHALFQLYVIRLQLLFLLSVVFRIPETIFLNSSILL